MSEPSHTVTVRYWAGARELAGTSEEVLAPGPVSGLLRQLAVRHGPGLARALAVSVVLVDGVAVERSADDAVAAGSVLEVLPPFSGG